MFFFQAKKNLKMTDLLLDKLGVVEDSAVEAGKVKALYDRMRNCQTVLVGLKIIARDMLSMGSGYKYCGPDVYDAWRREWFERFRDEFGLREASVALARRDYSHLPQPSSRHNYKKLLGLSNASVINYGAFKSQVRTSVCL